MIKIADVISNISNRLDKGIKIVRSKGKEFVEITRLKNEIKDFQASIETKFNSLGRKIYQMINKGNIVEEEIKNDCKEISLLFAKITELENAIKQVELEALKIRYGADIIICSKCKNPNKIGSNYCIICGALIVKVNQDSKICYVCNSAVQKNANFCTKSGAKID